MPESLETILRLVDEGKVTAAEAERILAAMGTDPGDDPAPTEAPGPTAEGQTRGRPLYVRIEVTEDGRSAVNIRLPVSLGELALLKVPGLARPEIERIREAIRTGMTGPIVATQDDEGNGVRILVE